MTVLTEILLSEPANLRDLGGIAVDGGNIVSGFAIRADDLTTIPEHTASHLAASGLKSVIDLRSNREVEVTGRGALMAHGVAYHHIPFMADLPKSKELKFEPGKMPDMSEFYPALFESAAPQIAMSLAIMAYSTGTVAFHCSAGRDRTGVLAAALLLALGADDETIIADYEATHPNTTAIMERTRPNLGHVFREYGLAVNTAAQLAITDPGADDAMRKTLVTLRARYGDPLAPIRAAGLTSSLVSQLRERAGV